MDYRLEEVKEMTGVLLTLNKTGIVEVKLLELNAQSARKLAAVLRSGQVTRENQDLFFTTIMVKKAQLEVFLKGQSSMVKDGNCYVLTTAPRNPLHFKGNLQTLVRGLDGKDHAWSLEIGNIEFDLLDKIPDINDDVAIFSNVSAVIYPTGLYRAALEA